MSGLTARFLPATRFLVFRLPLRRAARRLAMVWIMAALVHVGSAASDLVLTRVVPNSVVAGTPLTYSFTVSNAGPDAATLVRLVMEFDAVELLGLSATASQGTVGYADDGGYDQAAQFGTIAAGATATATVTVTPPDLQTILDKGRVSSPVESDPVSGNNLLTGSVSVTPGPGIFQFSASTFAGREGTGSVAISVQRRGGAVGTVSVGLATSNLTASAGSDYAGTNATLIFTNGEATKTFALPVFNDAIPECNEELRLALFNPAGGAIMLGWTNATLTIWDDELTLDGSIEAVSVNTNLPPQTANQYSEAPAVSADGSLVAFMSVGNNLVTNANPDYIDNIYVRNLTNHTTTLVSVTTNGTTGTRFSSDARISADGRFVAFESGAPGLVAGSDNNDKGAIFLRDTVANVTRLVSVNKTGVGRGDWHSFYPEMTPDGRFVVFSSGASDLTTNLSNFGIYKVFLRDMSNSVPELISVTVDGTTTANSDSFNATVSDDGRFVAFKTAASNVHPGATNGSVQVYVRDRTRGTNILCSVATNGVTAGNGDSASASISANGAVVVFRTFATNLKAGSNNGFGQIFTYDIASGELELVSVNASGTAAGNGLCYDPVVCADGRYVAFFGLADDIVPGAHGGQIFLRDRMTHTTLLVSVNCRGTGCGNVFSYQPRISADGRFVAFESWATDLVPGEYPPNTRNIFRRDLLTGVTSLATFNHDRTGGGNEDSDTVALGEDNLVISADGRAVVFVSQASNLVTNDSNGTRSDIFVWREPPASPPGTNAAIASLRMTGGHRTLTVMGSPGTLYLLQRTASLKPPVAWTPVRMTNAPANGQFEFIDSAPATGPAFYRVARP